MLRLLVLLAVLLMPLGMAPAAAAPTLHHAASMPMQHCPDQVPDHDAKGVAGCVMACSAALPAIEMATPQPLAVIHAAVTRPAIHRLADLHPDIATPPPRTF